MERSPEKAPKILFFTDEVAMRIVIFFDPSSFSPDERKIYAETHRATGKPGDTGNFGIYSCDTTYLKDGVITIRFNPARHDFDQEKINETIYGVIVTIANSARI